MCESNSLDEMTSFEVLNHTEMADSISAEFSIIPEPPPTTEESLTNGTFDNMQSAFMNASQDLSVQEIQSRIVELARDNSAMKDALEWNNVMMKEQLSTISAWHNQMTTTMSKQQLSLKESSDKLSDLERENIELREKLNQLESGAKEVYIQDSESVQNASCTERDREIAELRMKLEAQKLEDDRRVKEVGVCLDEAEQMVAELKLKLDEQNIELADLKQRDSERVILNASYELQKTENDALKSKCISLEQQLKECLDRDNEDKIANQCEILSLRKQILDLETEAALRNHAILEESTKHEETKKVVSDLQSKYDRVSRLLEIQSLNEKKPSMEQVEEGKKYLEQIDNLTAQLFELEEKMEERDERVSQLTLQLQTANKDTESVPVLKSQVEVYKLDLNQAQKLKEEADAEIQRLNVKILDLEARIEADAALDGDGHSRARRKQHAGGSRQGSRIFVCPVCDFGFNDPQAAQNHANKCLDEAQIR